MTRLLTLALVSASLVLASCASKKSDCATCCDSGGKKAASCCPTAKP
ncbi:MAG TPA: hypothetical protein PK490_07970 [Prosthecobacter sp.]|nr:hypothetical protein [Prosthecobacter sp.]HRK14213.1 hypothetical protein [Prosthecobacter sp.]